MAILAAYMVPHPPMIVPQIGRGSEKQIILQPSSADFPGLAKDRSI